VALFSIVSVANDWNVFDFLSEKFGSVFSVPIEEKQEYNGITITNHGKNTNYKTVEEALEKENIDVLYPAVLPNDIKVTDIMLYTQNSKNKMAYSFNDSDLYSYTTFDTFLDKSTKNGATEIIEINGIVCYISDLDDTNCIQIKFEYNGNTYMFSHTDKEVLVEIIENLEEINNEN